MSLNIIQQTPDALNKYIREEDNPDLTEERLKATFDTEELAAVVKHGKKVSFTVAVKRIILRTFYPLVKKPDPLMCVNF